MTDRMETGGMGVRRGEVGAGQGGGTGPGTGTGDPAGEREEQGGWDREVMVERKKEVRFGWCQQGW